MSIEKTSLVFILSAKIENEVNRKVDWLMGRILTIIDASFQDPEQRKAAKDLIKAEINNLRFNEGFIPQRHWIYRDLAEHLQEKKFMEFYHSLENHSPFIEGSQNIFSEVK